MPGPDDVKQEPIVSAAQPAVADVKQEADPAAKAAADEAQDLNARELSEQDVNMLLGDTDEGEGDEPPKSEVEEVKETPPAPAAKPADATPAKPEGAAKPAEPPKVDPAKPAEAPKPDAKPNEPAAAQPGAQPGDQLPKPQSMEELQQQFTKWKDDGVTLLAEQHYGKVISPELVKALEDEGAGPKMIETIKMVPRLMAQTYMDSLQQSMGLVITHLPKLIANVQAQQNSQRETEEKFFQRWPALRNHAADLMRVAATYRAHNPTASPEQFIEEAGAMAMVALRLPVQAPAAAAPAVPPVGQPFRPASAGARPAAQPAQQPANPFEQLAAGDLMEDMNPG